MNQLYIFTAPLFWTSFPFRPNFPGGSDGKESAYNAVYIRDVGSILGLGRSPGGGNGNPPQYSCLENSMGRGAWQTTVHGVVKELDPIERLPLSFPFRSPQSTD